MYDYKKLGAFLWGINIKRWELQRVLVDYQIEVDETELSLVYMGWDKAEEISSAKT